MDWVDPNDVVDEVGGIERGERNIAALNLIRIAKALKVEVGELFPLLKNLSNISLKTKLSLNFYFSFLDKKSFFQFGLSNTFRHYRKNKRKRPQFFNRKRLYL